MPASGLKTWLPAEVKKQFYVRDKLIATFADAHYEPIVVPSLVDISVLEATSKTKESSFKVMDSDGGILALRTDLTQPIAKAVSSRSSELEFPLRLYYASAIWRFTAGQTNDSREIQQTGIELIGLEEAKADIEVIELIVKCLKVLGLKDWTLTITHSAIWNAAISKYPGLAKDAYRLLSNSDIAGFKSKITDKHPLYLLLNGSLEEIEKAFEIDLSLLRKILKISPNIIFDSTQVPDIQFYTGLHFNLLAPGVGLELAKGGRYDKLYPSFDADLKAIGFAFYMPGLISALYERGLIPKS